MKSDWATDEQHGGLNNRISRLMQAKGKDLPQSFDDAKDKLRLKVLLS